jgi:hypothetical protein
MKTYLINLWKSWDCESPCSAPRIFGIRKWWHQHFAGECVIHDAYYKERVFARKLYADIRLVYLVANGGFVYRAVAVYIYFSTLGTVYWGWKKLWKR